jgi:hypothetical protein
MKSSLMAVALLKWCLSLITSFCIMLSSPNAVAWVQKTAKKPLTLPHGCSSRRIPLFASVETLFVPHTNSSKSEFECAKEIHLKLQGKLLKNKCEESERTINAEGSRPYHGLRFSWKRLGNPTLPVAAYATAFANFFQLDGRSCESKATRLRWDVLGKVVGRRYEGSIS